MSLRAWMSIITVVLIAVILFLSRKELLHAFELLGKVNLWVLALLIPVQAFVYYAGGEMIFSYLRAKKSIKQVSGWVLARMALEVNFVNHVLPSGGVSGVSYMTWRLGKYGVSPGRATMAQVVRFAMSFLSFVILLLIAVIVVTIDGNINRWIILVSSTLAAIIIGSILGGIYLFGSHQRMTRFSGWMVRWVNGVVRRITFGKRKNVLRREVIDHFFMEMHDDYKDLVADKRVMKKPFLWGMVYTLGDVGLFMITFWALGVEVNPAPILIAYGVATMAGIFVVTPGGAGAYEAIMVAFLAVAGIAQGTAIAGIVLTRVIVLIGTIVMGYVFYQHAIIKYGKDGNTPIQR